MRKHKINNIAQHNITKHIIAEPTDFYNLILKIYFYLINI